MIPVDRLLTIMREHKMTLSSMAREIGLAHSQMSKILNDGQSMHSSAIGQLFVKFNVHPLWLYGQMGMPDKIEYLGDGIPKSQYEELKNENLELYKKLAKCYELSSSQAESEGK